MNITSWLQYDFMRNALIAVLIITPLFGIMGTMIVNKKMAYFSDALGHSALTGIAVGVVCGMADTSLAMVIFAIVFALLLNKIGSLNTASTDTIISVFSSCSVAIGLAILSKGGNFSKYSSILVGDVLSITKTEIVYLIVIFVVTIVFWVFCFNKLNAICIHRSVAKSKGIHVRLLDNLFAVLVALIVMLSIKWIGILIINALLILPAASSLKPAVFASDLSVFASCFFEAVLVFFVCASSFAVTLCAATAETTLEIASNISHPSLVMCVRESFPAILLSTCIASDIAKQSFSYIVYRLFCICFL